MCELYILQVIHNMHLLFDRVRPSINCVMIDLKLLFYGDRGSYLQSLRRKVMLTF